MHNLLVIKLETHLKSFNNKMNSLLLGIKHKVKFKIIIIINYVFFFFFKFLLPKSIFINNTDMYVAVENCTSWTFII